MLYPDIIIVYDNKKYYEKQRNENKSEFINEKT